MGMVNKMNVEFYFEIETREKDEEWRNGRACVCVEKGGMGEE